MQVTFRTNVGMKDANRLGLDFTQCQAGQSLEVSDELAAALLDRGLIEPPEIHAVPPVAELQAIPPEGSVEKATDDLKRYIRKAKREKSGE